jgi:rubrerythrin
MANTEELLRSAFAGESQTNRRYLAYAIRAEEEGYPHVARLFRAAAASETIHAQNYLRALGEIRSTRENIREAFSVETTAFKKRYPEMMETARAEGNRDAERLFQYAMESEKIHARLFKKLLDDLEKPPQPISYHICQGCGHTAEKEPPEACPVCGMEGTLYSVVE